MKTRSGEKIRLASVKELLGVPGEQGTTEIELSRIQPFRNHPFYVRDDEQMDNLVESIKANGVLTPVLVRETDSGYEMVSGHRRMHASIRAGLTSIPAFIKNMTDDEAIVYMVDANIQREELLPSEKAFAIKMKLEAMKRQTGRKASEKNVSQVGTHLRSDQELAEQIGSSRNQVQRYVRLTMLIPALLKLVDEKKIPFTLGVEISYLDTQIQGWILEHVSRKGTIKQAQIAELRRGAETDSLNHDEVIQILGNAVGNHTKKKDLMIPAKTVLKYFGADVSEEKALETIITLLKKWRERSNEGETGTD